MRRYREAAKQGMVEAQYNLAVCLDRRGTYQRTAQQPTHRQRATCERVLLRQRATAARTTQHLVAYDVHACALSRRCQLLKQSTMLQHSTASSS